MYYPSKTLQVIFTVPNWQEDVGTVTK